MTLWRSIEVACLLLALLLSMWGCGSEPPSCPEGQELCGTQCFDVQTSANHCGACGASCEAGEVCSGGTCELGCAQGMSACEGGCFDTQASRAHCGACGTSCEVGQVCEAGACVLSCSQDLSQCDGGCVDTQSDENHCGACGTSCGLGELCVDGACAPNCAAGLDACDGACVDTQVDRANCGGCGVTCAGGEVCVAGSCELSCQDGFDICDDTCVDLQANADYCGDCNTACAAGELCQTGACVQTCEPGRDVCDQACVDLQTNDNYCGDCDTACSSEQDCVQGMCAERCLVGDTRCGGACVDTTQDREHCGSCGSVCGSGESCVEGVCEPCTDCPAFVSLFGGGGLDQISDLALDSQGNLYAPGFFSNSLLANGEVLVEQGASNLGDAILSKYSPTGRLLWARAFGSPEFDTASKVVVDAMDHVYVVGFFSQVIEIGGTTLSSNGSYDIFVAKYDPEGNALWAKSFGTPESDQSSGVAIDPVSGGLIVTGLFGASINGEPHGGSADIGLLRLDTSGNLESVKLFGGPGNDFGYNPVVDASGNVFLTGFFQNAVQWSATESSMSTGVFGLMVLKLSPTDEVIWVASADATQMTGYVRGVSLVLDGNGDIFITGTASDQVSFGMQTLDADIGDGFLAKLDSNGVWQWANLFGGAGNDGPISLDIVGSKIYVVGSVGAGFRLGSIATGSLGTGSAFLLEADTNGQLLTVTTVESSTFALFTRVLSDAAGNLFVSGRVAGNATLGLLSYLSRGGSDGIIAKYDAALLPTCPSQEHEVCSGSCQNTSVLDANCGGCGVACSAGAGETCIEGSCEVLPEGLVIDEVHPGNAFYMVLENRGNAPIDLSTVHYVIYSNSIGAPRATGALPSRQLQPGSKVYIIERGLSPRPGELQLDRQVFLSGVSPTFNALLCLGPCGGHHGNNVLDALSVGSFDDYMPFGISFSPEGLSSVSDANAESFLRQGHGGANPDFLQSDWRVGAMTR